MRHSMRAVSGLCALAILGSLLLAARVARAHCDTMDGPVISAARAALQSGDVTAVLKWVRATDEPELRHAFELAAIVRTKGPEARQLADQHFYETLVRLHRAGEGMPFEGIKQAGTPVGEAVEASDKALTIGSVDEVIKLVTARVEAGIRQRFAKAVETRRSADTSVEAGRQYVAAYVQFVHYVERLDLDASASHAQHAADDAATSAHESAEPAPAGHGHE